MEHNQENKNISKVSPQTLSLQSLATDGEFEAIKDFVRNEKAPATRSKYQKELDQLEKFASSRGVELFPVTPQLIAAYIGFLSNEGYKANSISNKVYSISSAVGELGYMSPVTKQISGVLKGLEKTRVRSGETISKADALLRDDIQDVCKNLSARADVRALRDRTILLVGFLGAFRRSELSRLKWSDLERYDDGYIVRVGATKNDQTGKKGHQKWLPKRASRTKEYFCPFRTLDTWRTVNQTEFVFPSLAKGGSMKDKHISGVDVDRCVKRYFGADFSAHSLRAGFITQADRDRIPKSMIMNQTGQTPSTVDGYIRLGEKTDHNAVNSIVNS